jgi:hypothetical protein
VTPREIIAAAWALTKKERCLWRWGFTEAFFETLLDLKLLSYQAYFAYEMWHGSKQGGFFDVEILIYNSMPHWFFWTFVISLTLLFIIELFMPHLTAGAIIGLAARAYRGEERRGGVVLALYNFFPIFAIHEFFMLSGWNLVVTTISVILRYIDGSIRYSLIVLLLILYVVSNIFKFFASFAEEAVVIRKEGIFTAMGKSSKLILSYLSHIMFLVLLLVVISLRIVVNALVLLLVPGIVVGIGIVLTFFLSPALSYSIASIVGIGLIVVVSYFVGYIHVFRQTVWTITYIELSRRKDLDVFEH